AGAVAKQRIGLPCDRASIDSSRSPHLPDCPARHDPPLWHVWCIGVTLNSFASLSWSRNRCAAEHPFLRGTPMRPNRLPDRVPYPPPCSVGGRPSQLEAHP